MKFLMYTWLFWIALNYAAMYLYKDQIIFNGWESKAYNVNSKMAFVVFILMMAIPIFRVIFLFAILYMAGHENDERF